MFNALPLSRGYMTIGFGHVIKAVEDFTSLTEQQALEILRTDVTEAARVVERLIYVPLKQNQFDALASFVFNLGAGALQRSTLRCCINRGEHNQVPRQLLRWVHAGGKILPGLVRRRVAEGAVYGG